MTDDEKGVTSNQSIGSAFRRIIKLKLNTQGININSLRSTFIRKCLESNMNIETVSLLSGMDKVLIYRYYGRFIKADPFAINRIDSVTASSTSENKQLKLLILGAGSHGHSVMETAEKLGVFRKIRFLDDNITAPDILGTCEDCVRFADEFPCAFVAIGDNDRRKYFAKKLVKAGFMLPHIIHPDATISKNATVGDGSIVMAQATVNASSVGKMCIIASNALVSYGATIEDYSHIDCGGIVMKDAKVPQMTLVGSGEIYR